MNAAYLIQRFHLVPHPEGGYYARTYENGRGTFSSILFLLTQDNFSAFHRIRSDEQWNWYCGDDIVLHEIDVHGNYKPLVLSGSSGHENFQYTVPGGSWFASECLGKNGYALCGCTVVPEFRFEDFELANREELIALHPQYKQMISRLTRV